MTELDTFIASLAPLAVARGGRLAPLDRAKVQARFHESDAALFNRGLRSGVLRIDERGYLFSADPHQTTAWMVEGGENAWPCWEYLPHGAAYVELIEELGFPKTSVRFETPGREHELDLDLAVVNTAGQVLIVGEAKKTSKELDALLAAMRPYCASDSGLPVGATGMTKAAWKLAYRLWATRAPYLWLIGPSDRRSFAVRYDAALELKFIDALPTPQDLGAMPGSPTHPLLQLALPVAT